MSGDRFSKDMESSTSSSSNSECTLQSTERSSVTVNSPSGCHQNKSASSTKESLVDIHNLIQRALIHPWQSFCVLVTCCFTPIFLEKVLQKKDPWTRQAWREKMTLCFIIFLFCVGMGYLTVGLDYSLCSNSANSSPLLNSTTLAPITYRFGIIVNGYEYEYYSSKRILSYVSNGGIQLNADWHGRDVSRLFLPQQDACVAFGIIPNCTVKNPISSNSADLPGIDQSCPSVQLLTAVGRRRLYLTWDQITSVHPPSNSLLAFNGLVLNITRYFSDDESFLGPKLTKVLQGLLRKDATIIIESSQDLRNALPCLIQKYLVGYVDPDPIGCIAKNIMLYVTLILVLSIVLTKFIMSVIYHLILSDRLVNDDSLAHDSEKSQMRDPNTIILVTCYSESEKQIRDTLDSIVNAEYPNNRKLIVVVCDGIVTGRGNDRPTAQVVLDLMTLSSSKKALMMPYSCLDPGAKQINRAAVFSGTYRQVPIVMVAKVGSNADRGSATPGNRGKRDSQVLLLNFLSKITSNDRLSLLEYEMFTHIRLLTKRTPDRYDMLLTLDSDTIIEKKSLRYMINAMKIDSKIIALCGESRISNKRQNWVTAIQVFEYYISHNFGKAFESVFGGVTCLPGCFSLYRIKIERAIDEWVPILISPEVIDSYSEKKLDTLHKKNLLQLGEDRYLTTLLLKAFPRRKTIYLPQAKCFTTAPDDINVLISQRRRWINSTIHNLLELIFVRDLCGIFCFSMQFVVLLELIGTIVLPISILAIFFLIISSIVYSQVSLLPMLILCSILGLPALLIGLVSFEMEYLAWMLAYLLALPIWNLLIPLFAFWNFDDFTWGETRVVSESDAPLDHLHDLPSSSKIEYKKWHEWENLNQQITLSDQSTEDGIDSFLSFDSSTSCI